MPSTFFDRVSDFFETSNIGTKVNGKPSSRLRNRYFAIIEAHRKALRGARVLDLGSHDGRFALAALDAGAAHVTGIEPRAVFREIADALAAKHGFADRVSFIDGDMVDALTEAPAKVFDVVLV